MLSTEPLDPQVAITRAALRMGRLATHIVPTESRSCESVPFMLQGEGGRGVEGVRWVGFCVAAHTQRERERDHGAE